MQQLLELPAVAYAPGGTNGALFCCTPSGSHYPSARPKYVVPTGCSAVKRM